MNRRRKLRLLQEAHRRATARFGACIHVQGMHLENAHLTLLRCQLGALPMSSLTRALDDLDRATGRMVRAGVTARNLRARIERLAP